MRVWQWNNAREVRALSGDPSPIPLPDHARWYVRALARPHTQLSIVLAGYREVGVVRIDRAAPAAPAIISISLDASCRGAGVGRAAVRVACVRYRAAHGPVSIDAWIHAANTASLRCFAAAGFARRGLALRDGLCWHLYRWEGASR